MADCTSTSNSCRTRLSEGSFFSVTSEFASHDFRCLSSRCSFPPKLQGFSIRHLKQPAPQAFRPGLSAGFCITLKCLLQGVLRQMTVFEDARQKSPANPGDRLDRHTRPSLQEDLARQPLAGRLPAANGTWGPLSFHPAQNDAPPAAIISEFRRSRKKAPNSRSMPPASFCSKAPELPKPDPVFRAFSLPSPVAVQKAVRYVFTARASPIHSTSGCRKEREMNSMTADRRMVWLLTGVIAGLGLAALWPAEPVHAIATDRSDRFAICTVDVGPGTSDAVFVLDFLTGRLTGALLNSQSGIFTNFYFRNVAADFIVDPNTKAKYAIIPGAGFLNTGGGLTTASGVVYIGELSSGKLVAYRFPYRNSARPPRRDAARSVRVLLLPRRRAERVGTVARSFAKGVVAALSPRPSKTLGVPPIYGNRSATIHRASPTSAREDDRQARPHPCVEVVAARPPHRAGCDGT